ncbi:hypothetical protein JXA32_15375 [Candidatus Sumerlaeota bacterium]|nr:hypothetical protein [Candidatus Sumerlaeota bacterium]
MILKQSSKALGTIVLTALGAVCYALAFPPMEWASLGWLAFLCWMLAIGRRSERWQLYGMLAGGYIVAALGLWWLTAIFDVYAACLWIIFAAYFAIWGGLLHMTEKQSMWLRLLWPAVAWCALEYVKGELNPLRFSWLSLGYSQINWLGFTLASWIGVYGVSFLMVLWATLTMELLHTFHRDRLRKQGVALAALAAIPLLACIPAGEWSGPAIGTARLQQYSDDQGAAGIRTSNYGHEKAVDLVVWPEYCFNDNPSKPNAACLRVIQRAAQVSHWGIIVGAIQEAEDGADFYNTAFFIDPSGAIIGSAVKNQPIQLMKDGLPAKEVTVIEHAVADGATTRTLRFGVGICYDGSYQQYVRRMAQRDAETLIFPALNLEPWGAMQHTQHQRLFQFRAAETHLPVLVAAFSGPTFVAMPNGASGPLLPYHQTAELDVEIPARGGRTLFILGGWLVAPLCLMLAIGALAFMLLHRRIKPQADQSQEDGA